MVFEWDPAKHNRNLRSRGIGFDEAAMIFDGETVVWPDPRTDYGEARCNALGMVDGKVLRVVFTMRADVVRIISAWKANRKDRQRWLDRA